MAKKGATLRIALALATAGVVAACAQIEGLDGFSKVDCLDDCPESGTPPLEASTPDGSTPDAKPTCPPCSGATPVCDPASLKCVECLPGTLACAVGKFCDPDPEAGFKCVQGCGVVDDCIKASGGDAGTDGGDAGGDAGAGTLGCCNNRCVDTSTSNTHCGVCGNACLSGTACCGSACTDVTSSATTCGGCGKTCSGNHVPATACTVGKCSGACDTGFDDCNANKLADGCESDIFNDPSKCGGCLKVCSTNHVPAPTCDVGSCSGTCEAGFADCNNNKLVDGCEVNLGNDPNHCGGCPNACSNNHIATPTCAGSVCNGTCNPGFKDCNANKLADGCETNVTTNADACGACGAVCSGNNMLTRTCNTGACNGTCNAGFDDCNNDKLTDGCETDLDNDATHCGGCLAHVCSSNHVTTPTCGGGTCNGACDPGWTDCNANELADGCESRTDLDTTRCGAGCAACPAGNRNCAAGVCTPGYGQTFAPIAFVDACAQVGASRILQNQDDATQTVFAPAGAPFPFSFLYYGSAVSALWISSNGVLGFSATPSGQFTFTCGLPQTQPPDPIIAVFPYARDLITRGPASVPPVPGGICYATIGAAPNRRVVVTWSDASKCCSDDAADPHLTFSVMLEETTNRIDVVYETLTAGAGYVPDAHDALVGLQGNTPFGQPATTFSCAGAPALSRIAPGSTITFVP